MLDLFFFLIKKNPHNINQLFIPHQNPAIFNLAFLKVKQEEGTSFFSVPRKWEGGS